MKEVTKAATLPPSILGLIARACGALPDAWLAHRDGVPRELVEELQSVLRNASRGDALYPEDALPADWSRKALIAANASNDYTEFAPRWAYLQVTPDYLRRLRDAAALLEAHELDQVRLVGAPDAWGTSEEHECSLIDPQIAVDRRGFWFVDTPKHEDVDIETRSVRVNEFIDEIIAAGKDSVTVFGVDAEAAEALLEDWQASQPDAKDAEVEGT